MITRRETSNCSPSLPSLFIAWSVLLLVLAGIHAPFLRGSDKGPPRFCWDKTLSRGPIEFYKVHFDGAGKGSFQLKRRYLDVVEQELVLKPSTVEKLLSLFVQADFLNENKNFVSARKVADMGMKTIRFEAVSGKREVTFNFTEDRGLQQIVSFFENLCSQETCLFEIELALKYDRLGIPKKLDELQRNFSSNRIVAPERFTDVLDRVYQDESLMNYARVEAKKLLSKIEQMPAK